MAAYIYIAIFDKEKKKFFLLTAFVPSSVVFAPVYRPVLTRVIIDNCYEF
jgi:hypothetical protein